MGFPVLEVFTDAAMTFINIAEKALEDAIKRQNKTIVEIDLSLIHI